MIEFIKNFFQPKYLFSLRPEIIHQAGLKILISVFGGCLVLAGISKVIAMIKKKDWLLYKAWQRFFSLFLTMGVLGALYTFFAYERAVLLSARFLLLIWLVVFLSWLFFDFYYLLIKIPKIKKNIQEKKKFQQYLP